MISAPRSCLAFLFAAVSALAAIKPPAFDVAAIRDPATLETRVIQDWAPAKNDAAVRQKLVEITVCEWWPGQRVRLPVTFNVPAAGGPCRQVIIANMGVAPRPALPTGAMLRLLKEHGVGVVMIGMSPIEAMPPEGQLHLGMQRQLLATKDARFTPAWIWGMSDMRALTAAIAERDAFQPVKVLATGGSKRGIGAAAAGIHDDRFTAIMPVVAPPLGNPGGSYVLGTEPAENVAASREFLAALAAGKFATLPRTAHAALTDRDARRGNERISAEQARAAGWSADEIAAMNDAAWDASRLVPHLAALERRGLAIFYNLGTNDNVSPDLLELGRRFPAFPLYLTPGGQHGGPKGAGFTREVPSQREVEENLFAFARHHFSGARGRVATPLLRHEWDRTRGVLRVTVSFPDGAEPQRNELWWSVDRHPANTLPYEYDAWQSVALRRTGPGTFAGEAAAPAGVRTVDFVTTHRHTENDLPLSVSSPLLRVTAGGK